MQFKCVITEVTPLRLPKVYRVKGLCGDVEVEIEFHEDMLKKPSVNSTLNLDISGSREICQPHYFCAHGHVISNAQLGDLYRVVVSLHGLLLVLRSKERFNLNAMDHVYLGATVAQS
ncbi:MAG: DNA-directed RNA polymerase subunit G [Desulfurococcaceae archaeon]